MIISGVHLYSSREVHGSLLSKVPGNTLAVSCFLHHLDNKQSNPSMHFGYLSFSGKASIHD
jgi:hypothetical protein